MALSNTSAVALVRGQQGPESPPPMTVDPEEAWKPYEPNSDHPWTLALAGHLHRRAGFGASWEQLHKTLESGPQRSVDQLLSTVGAPENERFDQFEQAAARGGSVDTFRAWWLRRLVETRAVLREKMTLFWHNHFATSAARVGSALVFQQYVALLRRDSLGRFDQLLAAVCQQPAVLLASGAEASRKSQPPVGLARNLLERFSLGPSQFSDDDVREVARAMTGWFVLRNHLRFIPYEHDDGVKQFLGRKGKFGIEEAVRIVLEQQATPRYIVRKLYRWFISDIDQPSDELLEPLSARFARDFDVAAVVETILRSKLFFSPAAYRRKVKSPLEFATGIIRAMEAVVPSVQLGNDLAAMGEDLCRPPTGAGWPGGIYWLSPAAMLARQRLAAALLAEGGPYEKRIDPWQLATRHGFQQPDEMAQFLLKLFVQDDLEAPVRNVLLDSRQAASLGNNANQQLRAFTIAVLALPEFHLA